MFNDDEFAYDERRQKGAKDGTYRLNLGGQRFWIEKECLTLTIVFFLVLCFLTC